MAKYTELLQEYLEDGNELPSIFSEIEGFEDLFIARFCDHELGFETENLFAIKLEHYANMYIPLYKERIADVASALTKAKTPLKTVYTQADLGKRKTQRSDLPIESGQTDDDITPSGITISDASTDNTKVEESGQNTKDALELLAFLNTQVKVVVDDLLKQFDKCFMRIY